MAKSFQELSISDVESQGLSNSIPIYAINSSAESAIGQSGEILLSIPKINGSKADSLRIPQTWLPVELTLQISRQQLLAASEFRQALQAKLIILISKEDAVKMNSQSGARLERGRIAAAQNHVRTAGAARSISSSNTKITRADGNTEESDQESQDYENLSVAQKAQAGVENVENGITPSFQMWADRLVSDTDQGVINTMRSKGRFSRLELKFLLKTLDSATHAKAVARIKKTLAAK